MPRDLWEPLIDEVGRSGEPCSVVTHGAGEPLLHPNLRDLVVHAKKYANLTVGFLTNGMYLSEEVSAWVVGHDVDWIAFSVDGIDPATHAEYRVNSDLPRIEGNIRRLVRLRGAARSPRIHFNMVRLPALEDQVEPYVERWRDIADEIMISRYRPIGKRSFLTTPIERKPCPHLYRQMVIGWDGRVALCCEDIFVDVPIGNAAEQSIEEIWAGPRIRELRMAHERGDYASIALCSDCDTWAGDMDLSPPEEVGGGVMKVEKAAATVYRPRR